MTLNKAPSHYSMNDDKNIPIDYPTTLSLKNDENFKLIIALIECEFESKKDNFKNFKTEREFLSSHELKEFIVNIKPYIVCWRIRPEHLSWLDEYLKSLLVEHWRSLPKEPKPIQPIKENVEDSGPIPTETEVNSAPVEIKYTPHSKFNFSPSYTRLGFTLEQVNFRLIWTDLNRKETPHLEIPATLCLVDARVASTQAQNYSWELFVNTFQKLLNDENCESVQFNQGFISYAHPENGMRAIKNQIQFSVALNHMLCGLQGCVAKFFYCGSKEVIDSRNGKNAINKVHHFATHPDGNKRTLKSSSNVSMLRRKTLKERRLKAVAENPYYSRSSLYRSASKGKTRGFHPSQKLGRSCI